MDLLETLRISWLNIRSHTLRSVLTTLGVVIGVAAVITFVTLGAGLQADIVQTIAGDNADVLYVSAESGSDGGLPSVAGGELVFTTHDVEQIGGIDGVAEVAPRGGIAASSVSYGNSSVSRQVVSVASRNYFALKGFRFVDGRPYRTGQEEVVLNDAAAGMFDENVSVGDRITFVRAATNEPLNATVVGIVRDRAPGGSAAESALGQEPQPTIYAPPDPYYENREVSPTQGTRQRVYNQVVVEAESPGQVEAVQGRIYAYLGDRSDARVLKASESQFDVTTYDQLVNEIQDVSSTFTAYITGVAFVSLLVGAIGIANIMLVSVTERTREIGVMKAIGAQKRDVLQLFLFESVLLGVVGAVTGAAAGALGGFVGTRLIGLPLAFRPEWFALSVVVGVVVGVVAGLYPAWSAASTDPIDALRYE